jgi:hypothetical protein
MRTVFLVPRRADGGLRDQLWAWCRRRWEAEMPDVPIYEGHHTEGPFNRSAAINHAARLADADGHWDVAIVIDADVFLPIPNVRAAIASAGEGMVTWAHRRWRNIAERHLKRLLADPDPYGQVPAAARDMDLIVDVTNPISWSCCVAIPRSTFDDMGGFDERFRGWGFEDGAWAALVRALYPWNRIDGDMYHLDHPRSDERIILGEPRSTASSDYVRNALLGRRYMIAAIRDHAAGDQQGEERLSPEMVHVHVSNLTRDDEKFLAMARQKGMPEASWANWWPTLEELRDGAKELGGRIARDVAVILRTGGEEETWEDRVSYLRRSLASLAERVRGPIVQRVIYSDWGHARKAELDAIAAEHGFYVVGPERHRGYTASAQLLWRYLDARVRADFIFLTEDDFVYERDVDLEPFLDTLEANPQLRQVALLRDPYPSEVERGGVLGWPAESFELRDAGNGHGRLEHRNFWTMNPSLMRRSIAKMPWPSQSSSERGFGDAVLRDPDARGALWGTGEPGITHIGATRAASAY